MPNSTSHYPPNWPAIAQRVKDAARWRCIRCGHPHDPASGHTLTVHHLDGIKANCAWWNLAALCQRCHLTIQAKVVMERVWYLPHSEWIRPYVAGWSAWRYLGLQLSRDQVMENLDYYVDLQRRLVEG